MQPLNPPRIKSPVFTLPNGFEALRALAQGVEGSGLPRATLELVNVRVGQLNGCSVCVDMHCRALSKLGEKPERIALVAAFRDAPYYTAAERAALALAEASTRLSDRSCAVPDDVWQEAARHYSEAELGALVMGIALANLWNRLNVPTGQVTGEWVEKYA